MTSTKRRRHGFMQQHGLGLAVAAILLTWLVLYVRSDPATHLGAFFGNATADWLGTLIIVVATKYFYEIGSAKSRPPHPKSRGRFARFLMDDSPTIVLVAT